MIKVRLPRGGTRKGEERTTLIVVPWGRGGCSCRGNAGMQWRGEADAGCGAATSPAFCANLYVVSSVCQCASVVCLYSFMCLNVTFYTAN